MVDPKQSESIRAYIKSVEGSEITLDSGEKVTILKGDVKEKKEDAILIYRYQLV
ncbi:hypothetical protein [Natronincola peptidivorans]|uniref:hypothetical protein n=1 Tax=Natronincola peptidivorans TaxID=426128 RepID=UPI00147C76D8|nr:hypothetical protein [Natronincola peptidivorans]